jgi:tyrosine-protein kinase Etk/Wzc
MTRKEVIGELMTETEGNEVSLIDLLLILANRKRVLTIVPLVVGAIALAVAFAMPSLYRASVTLLPPQQSQSGAAALMAQMGGAAGLVAGAAGLKNPNDMYVSMLKSRAVADNIGKRFALAEAYGTQSPERVRAILSSRTTVVAGKDGLISVEVLDEDQARVPNIANAYVDELAQLNRTLALTEAAQRRLFYEQQLKGAKDNLAAAEIKLKQGLGASGVISVDGESQAMVQTVGRLRAQISAKEVQLNSMRAFVTASNPEFVRVQQELSSMRAELGHLENGRPNAVPASPSVEGLENIRTLRDVKYYQMLYELLAKQYEMARLDEAKDGAVIQVLDKAIQPEKKFKPQRALIVFSAMLAALFFTAIFVVSRALWIRSRASRLAFPGSRARDSAL